MTKNTRTPDEDDMSSYHKMKNKLSINLRLKAEEKSLLESMMRKEGWENVSGFIRDRLFGQDVEKRVDRMIHERNTDDLVTLLKNGVLQVAEYFLYYYGRYEKDMRQLWKEPGVDMKAWTSATNHWHTKITNRVEEMLRLCRKIAAELGLMEYFELPSDKMDVDWDATPDELDKVANQLRKERVAMGRLDNM